MRLNPTAKIALSIVSVLIAALWAGADSHAQAPPTKIVAAMGSPGLLWTPLYVARDRGFLAEEGIEVQNLVVEGANALTAVLSGDAHVAFGTVHLILARSRGEKVKGFVAMQEQFGVALVLSNSAIEKAGIKASMPVDQKLRLLRGLKIGISAPGASIDILIRALTVGVGLKPDQDLKLVPFGGQGLAMIAAMERGVIDGFMYTAPWPEEAVERKLGQIVLNPQIGEVEQVAGVSYLAFYGREEWLKSKPDEALHFTRAIAKALHFIHENPDATFEIVRKYVPDIQRSVLAAAFKNYVVSAPKDPRISRPSMDKAVWFYNLGLPPEKQTKLTYEELVAPEFADRAMKELGY